MSLVRGSAFNSPACGRQLLKLSAHSESLLKITYLRVNILTVFQRVSNLDCIRIINILGKYPYCFLRASNLRKEGLYCQPDKYPYYFSMVSNEVNMKSFIRNGKYPYRFSTVSNTYSYKDKTKINTPPLFSTVLSKNTGILKKGEMLFVYSYM